MSNRTGKRATNEIPSNVPNDYEHLGVPGSVNMRLSGRGSKRRPQVRRRGSMPNWLKALVAMSAGALAFGVVMLVIFIIAFPPFFRDLEPRYQQRLIDIFPPFDSLRPTVPFDTIPTLGGSSDSDAAQQLLLTLDSEDAETLSAEETAASADPQTTPLPTTTLDVGENSSTEDSADTPGGLPVGMVGTPTPSPLPTYVAPTPAQVDTAALPTWTPVFIPTEAPLDKSYKLNLTQIKYEQQGWNNCGPTTMTMALSYFGWGNDQNTAAKWMKPHSEDKNVSPWQMVRFVNENTSSTNVKALYRIGGTTTMLKRLLAANFPVVIEESIQPEGEGWMGHYVLLVGYDDYEQHFLTFDSYLGSNQQQGRPSPYSIFDEKWRHFNRMFIVLYTQDRESELRKVLGDYVDPAYGYQSSLAMARAAADRDRSDKWAWFNMGSAYVALKQYDNAAIAYEQALRLNLPFRMLWYQFGPYEAFFNIGDYNNVRALANSTIATTEYVEESYYWKGMAYAAEGNTSEALKQFNLALRYNTNFFPAQEAKAQVEAGTFVAQRS